jgi:hypothetical protein
MGYQYGVFKAVNPNSPWLSFGIARALIRAIVRNVITLVLEAVHG